LLRYGREDNRRISNGEQVNRVAGLAMASKQSVDFCGNWQWHIQPTGADCLIPNGNTAIDCP
jgi:hypothetical protein